MIDRQIVLNSVQCLECDEILVSHHRHDYVTCSCENRAMCDGGTSYVRSGGKVKYLTVYSDEPFELVRISAERGSRGVDGSEPLHWIKICDMSDEHLQAVLDYGGEKWHLDIIKKEIEWREKK